MNETVTLYLSLKQDYEATEDIEEQDRLLVKIEEVYFELDDDDLAYVESLEIN